MTGYDRIAYYANEAHCLSQNIFEILKREDVNNEAIEEEADQIQVFLESIRSVAYMNGGDEEQFVQPEDSISSEGVYEIALVFDGGREGHRPKVWERTHVNAESPHDAYEQAQERGLDMEYSDGRGGLAFTHVLSGPAAEDPHNSDQQ